MTEEATDLITELVTALQCANALNAKKQNWSITSPFQKTVDCLIEEAETDIAEKKIAAK